LEKDVAKDLVVKFAELGAAMNVVATAIEAVDVDDKKRELRRGIADLMGLLYTELLRPIILEFPDLDPDKLRP
jgi:hypothetical protein